MSEEARCRPGPAGLVAAVGAIMLLGSACTSQGSSPLPAAQPSPPASTTPATPQPSPNTSPTTTLVAEADCPRTLEPASIGLPEFKGHSESSVTLYGLLFARYPLPAGQVSKIAWRMTGSGNMRFAATGPRGQRIAPAWATLHYGSSWHRPGEEWGTGFRFPAPGCWTVRVTRGTSAATASLLVK